MKRLSFEILKALLCGMTISTLFFIPLLNTLNSDNYPYLFWNNQDTIETTLSWVTLGSLFGVAFLYVNHKNNFKFTAFFYLLSLIFGGFFAAGAIGRSVYITSAYNAIEKSPATLHAIYILIATLLIISLILAAFSPYVIGAKISKQLIYLFAPLNILFIFNLGNAQFKSITQHQNLPQTVFRIQEKVFKKTNNPSPLNVILLFDELSADYLYGSRAVNMQEFPAIKRLLETSNKFTNAFIPGGQTNKSIPALFETNFQGTNLKELITAQEPNVSITGWYLDYCNTFFSGIKNCDAFSFFNIRTINKNFSLLNPILTNINLLPYKKPFGYIKIPAATSLHKKTLEAIDIRVLDALNGKGIDFIYAHYDIPHTPLLDNSKYSPTAASRFEASEAQYIEQFKYINNSIDMTEKQLQVISQSRPINFFVLSDHNYRAHIPKDQHEHVVLIYKHYPDIYYSDRKLMQKVNSPEAIASIINK